MILLYTCLYIDDTLDLDNLLRQVQNEVTGSWYQLGEAAGVPSDLLNKCSQHSSEECVIEVLDYWLRNCGETKRKWTDVADILNITGFRSLAGRIMRAYETGS